MLPKETLEGGLQQVTDGEGRCGRDQHEGRGTGRAGGAGADASQLGPGVRPCSSASKSDCALREGFLRQMRTRAGVRGPRADGANESPLLSRQQNAVSQLESLLLTPARPGHAGCCRVLPSRCL